MAQNFLYMFEFVVDDLLVTRPNNCAPEEYPTCCEISFRSSVFVSICDREFGQCVDSCAPKCGKCCLFSLESPVTDKDRLLIHIYKKKTDKCKFLLGATDFPIKSLFDKVTESFNVENPNWLEQVSKHAATLPDPKTPSKTTVVDNECDEEPCGRKEQMCPTSELTKRLLPLFNMKGVQTGNLVLIMRLVCNGPTIVSSFPFSKICTTACAKKPKPCPSCPVCPSPEPKPASNSTCQLADPCKKEEPKQIKCRRYFACNADKGCPCPECEDECDRECPYTCKKGKKKQSKCPMCQPPPPPPPCKPQEPCKKKPEAKEICQRFFSSSSGGGNNCCPCDECADECEAEECCTEEESEPCIPPCFINPTKPDPGPDAYEEFEACLNGSGLVIRVLKDTHQVQSINDGDGFEDNGSEYDKCRDKCGPIKSESVNDFLQHSNYAQNYIKRRTAGHIINNPRLPKIRANIKYSGNDSCCSEEYNLPLTKMKQFCENQENKLCKYRRYKNDSCIPPMPLKHPDNIRNCCLQVDPKDITNALRGINTDARKKGIEVCYKSCENTDSDVFLVKLGSKQRCQKKKNSIEIELKTPKQALLIPKQKVTTETQITETELDNEMANTCKKRRKGKKGKKKK